MSNFRYVRVNRKNPCEVCGKPDWCSRTADAKISFCARITDGADRISRESWGVFYHDKNLLDKQPFFCPVEPPPKPALAPLEIRHFVYQKLIALAPASDCDEIINGAKGLRARKILDFENYGSLPRARSERQSLAKTIRNLISQTFPQYVKTRGTGVAGLPGFWLDEQGRVQIWHERDYSCPMLLIPYRNEQGLIQACQIRFMCKQIQSGARYVWLSTPEQNGVSCGAPLHFAGRANRRLKNSNTILVTEGALKAETVQTFKPEVQVVAGGGVSCAHAEIIETARHKSLLLAFDADYQDNPQVVRHLARLVRARLDGVENDEYKFNIKILTWNKTYKGLDDALLNQQPISELSLVEWVKLLATNCQNVFLSIMNLSSSPS